MKVVRCTVRLEMQFSKIIKKSIRILDRDCDYNVRGFFFLSK